MKPKTIFEFVLGGWTLDWCSLRIDKYADEYICTMANRGKPFEEIKKGVPKEQVERLTNFIKKSGIRNWKRYYDASALDGENWSIMIDDAEGKFESSGFDKRPQGFNSLLECLHDIFGLESDPTEVSYESLFEG